MKLLIVGDADPDEFSEGFDEVEQIEIPETAPEVIDGESKLDINGYSYEEFDSIYARIPSTNPIFGRILLQTLETTGNKMNYSSTGFFLTAKKNYLAYNLEELGVPHPNTVVVAAEKAGRNATSHVETPVIAERRSNYSLTEKRRIEDPEEVENFIKGTQYDDTVVILKEDLEGSLYRSFVAGDNIISLEAENPESSLDEAEFKYSEIPDDLEDTVKGASSKIGINVCEVVTRGDRVFDVNPNPDLNFYKEKSGKDSYRMVREVLIE